MIETFEKLFKTIKLVLYDDSLDDTMKIKVIKKIFESYIDKFVK